jgi:hypothetical protein
MRTPAPAILLLALAGCGTPLVLPFTLTDTGADTLPEAREQCHDVGLSDDLIDGMILTIQRAYDRGVSAEQQRTDLQEGCQEACGDQSCLDDCWDCGSAVIDALYAE